ncbi:7077_t:CDS:1 [Ambispora gerdemannii]|uniref:7077_t:CDS:1 n=1 Tax=Ambispora gerdemannii TaxID=144530 RepID=A0A9N9AIH9_9GLOM|nr:7077_t:CDS:1 [Ambispora gerdemannii]
MWDKPVYGVFINACSASTKDFLTVMMMTHYLNIYIFALFFNFLFVSLVGVPTKYEIPIIDVNVETSAKGDNYDNFEISIIHGQVKSIAIDSIDNNREQKDDFLTSIHMQYSVYHQKYDDFIFIYFNGMSPPEESSCLHHYSQRIASIQIRSLEGKKFFPGDKNFSLGNDPESLDKVRLRNCQFVVDAYDKLLVNPDNMFLTNFVMEYVKSGESYNFYVRPGWKFEKV